MFVPSKPRQGCRKRLGSNVRRSSCSPTAAELQSTSPALHQSTASSAINQTQEITATHNEAPVLNQMGHTQSECSTDSTKAQQTELSQEVLRKEQTQCNYSVHKGKKRENHKVQFDDSGSSSQSSQEANAAQITNTERPWDPSSRPRSQGEIKVNREKSLTGLMPRPPIPPGSCPVNKLRTVGKEGVTFLDLQNSFSKSEAHRNFNNSITHATVNLQDNVVSGKKHNFFGINCHYMHG